MSSATKRWIHVSFSWPSGANPEQVESLFNKATDWVKYSRNCWLLYTGLDLEVWAKRVRALPGMEKQNVFVMEVDDPHTAEGFLPDWIWDKLYEYDDD
jgi:hypothetical protein